MNRDGKYLWCDGEFKKWCDKEADKMRQKGFNLNTRQVTMHLLDKVIVPNKIRLTQLLKPKINLNKRKWKQRMI